MERITERDLRGVVRARLARAMPGRPLQVHSESGLWILDQMEGTEEPERWRIHRRMQTCRTKRELYDWIHAFCDGMEQRDYFDPKDTACKLCGEPLYGMVRVHHHNDPETGETASASLGVVTLCAGILAALYLASHVGAWLLKMAEGVTP